MSTNYKISQLRDLFNDWETGLDQAVTLLPLFPIDVINEYWSLGWMQNPGNPDDRWKSDWIRAILMAYATEGSLPYDARKQDRIRHRKEESRESKEIFDKLELNSDWNHLSDKLLHDIIKNLGVTKLEFRSIELFEKYLRQPADVLQIIVYFSNWSNVPTSIKDNDLAKTISERIPRGIESLNLSIGDNYKINFSENALSELKNLNSFTFESNSNNGVLNFSNNILLEEINIKLRSKEDTLSIKGLNNCSQLKVVIISSESKGSIIVEPVEISKLSHLVTFNISNVIHQGDIKGIIKNKFNFNNFYNSSDAVEGIKHIDIEFCPTSDSNSNEVGLSAALDLETIKIRGEVENVELSILPKLNELTIDLIGESRFIHLEFSRELKSIPQISANSLTLLSLKNYKNKEFPFVTINKIGERPYYRYFDISDYCIISEKWFYFKIDNSSLEYLDGLENIKCDTVLILNANNELKKLFKDPSVRYANIKKLHITNSTITNLDGINQFPNLTELVLNDLYSLETINGLETLKQLKSIDLSNCSLLTSLEPLANLTTITDLKLSGCKALKPKPKRINLTGMQVFEELNRHNKSKPKRESVASSVSITKIIEFFNSAEADSINQGFMLLSLCNPDELNRLYNSVDYDEKTGKLVFTYLPKSILEDNNVSKLISLLLLFEAPEESLAGQYRNKIESLFLNCDVEVNKPKLTVGAFKNIDFTPYFNSIGKFSKFKNLKQIQIEEFATFDFIDMPEVPSIVDIHISNIKTILNFDSIAINKNLIKLKIQEQYYANQSANNATHLLDVAFSSNFSSLEFLKLNLNCDSITGLEHLINCNDLRLIIHASLEKISFSSAMKKLEYMYLNGWFYTIENIEQLPKLKKLDITEAFLHEPKFLNNLLSNEDYILNKGILENTKFS